MTELATPGARLAALLQASHERGEAPMRVGELAAAADVAGSATVTADLITALLDSADGPSHAVTVAQLDQINAQFELAPPRFLSSSDPDWVEDVASQLELLSALRDSGVRCMTSCGPRPGEGAAGQRRALARALRATVAGTGESTAASGE